MRYYKFDIDAYRRDTGHLTIEEHGIYRWLIDQYFETETPIPNDTRKLSRYMRLTSDQVETLQELLNEFFTLTDDGYIHNKVEEELQIVYEKSESARKSAAARWAKNHAGYNNNANANRTQSKRKANGMLPRTKNQEPNKKSKPKKAKAFTPPTIDEVKAYALQRGYPEQAQKFFDYYEAGKWYDQNGKQVKNWKQKFISTWESINEKSSRADKPKSKTDSFWDHTKARIAATA